jgi:DNA polymerase I
MSSNSSLNCVRETVAVPASNIAAQRRLDLRMTEVKKRYPDGIFIFDFEYHVPPGHRPLPLCWVVHDMLTGERFPQWLYGTGSYQRPFPTASKALWVGYGLTGDLQCFIALNWPMPDNVIDLHVEHFVQVNDGTELTLKNRKLLQVLDFQGIESIGAETKEAGRAIPIRGPLPGSVPFTQEEIAETLEYCGTDVTATRKLATCIFSNDYFSLRHAIQRAQFVKVCAAMEWTGIPIDSERLARFREVRPEIVRHVIETCDSTHAVFDETGAFSYQRFAQWILDHNLLDWPTDEHGKPDANEDIFNVMAEKHAMVRPLNDARRALKKLVERKESLTIGPDGRSRFWPAPFTSKTSRSVPSANLCIFSRSAWERTEFIKPPRGWACAYIDYRGQEFGIAGVLSQCPNLLADYRPDCHMACAIRANLAPPGATQETHFKERNIAKKVGFAILYGSGVHGLAAQLNKSTGFAFRLLSQYQEIYPEFAAWSAGVVDRARRDNFIINKFGWRMLLTPETKDNTLKNFHIQSLGADMIRAAAFYAIDAGVSVAATVHDALFVIARDEDIERQKGLALDAMARASRWALDGFELDIDAKVIRYPDSFPDARGGDIRRKYIDPFLDRVGVHTVGQVPVHPYSLLI